MSHAKAQRRKVTPSWRALRLGVSLSEGLRLVRVDGIGQAGHVTGQVVGIGQLLQVLERTGGAGLERLQAQGVRVVAVLPREAVRAAVYVLLADLALLRLPRPPGAPG